MPPEAVEAIEIALDRLSQARARPHGVLLGVSGGPDSLALLLAAAAGPASRPVFVATVDHGLRPEGPTEAAFVATLCRDFGLPHRTLRWDGPKPPRGNLMAAAREARYRLLSAEALRVGAGALMVAHHADDQIETHLLARGRGGTGASLAGMRPWRDLDPGLVLLRPFLDLPKLALGALVERAGLRPVIDPTNADRRYGRARVRSELQGGAHDGAAIRRAIAHAAALREASDAETGDAIRRACEEGRLEVDAEGRARVKAAAGSPVPWSRLLTAAGGGLHPPERLAVEHLTARLDRRDVAAATLGGCRVERIGDDVTASREFGRSGPAGLDAADETTLTFDRRFTIRPPVAGETRRIEALGRLGLGNAVHRTLPVGVGGDGRLSAVHPALAGRFPTAALLAVRQRIGWRIWADLPGDPPDRLTAQPQNAANHREAVGKDLEATYLRGRVKVRAP